MTTLVVTNDFPPRIGGIESCVAHPSRVLHDDLAVVTTTAPRAAGENRGRRVRGRPHL